MYHAARRISHCVQKTGASLDDIFANVFCILQHIFMNPNATFHLREMYISRDEVSITPVLNQVNEKFKGQITLGSYPDFYNR